MEFNADIHSIKCPKCGHGMEEIAHDDVEIDRCTHCKGLWFDAGEAERLKGIDGSEKIDIGDSKEGWKWDSHADIDCPRCDKQMEKGHDPKQKHIWFEACPDGHGMFMDAGEFSDYKEESVLDFFRSLIKGRRDVVAP